MDCRDTVCIDGSAEKKGNGMNCNDTNPDNCLIPTCDFDGECSTMNQTDAPKGTPCKQNDMPGICDDNGNCSTGG